MIFLVVGVLYLPFISQAFHIDDRIYLEIAGTALEKPFFPYDSPTLFEGLIAPDGASHSHLPLTSYYLALVRLLTGAESEWVFHLAFLVFPLLAGFSFYDLARRFVRVPLAATVLLLGAPAFLVLGHTLMPDVPLLAFWLLALSRFLRLASGEGVMADRVILILAILGAAFISMVSAGLVLLMAAYLVLDRRKPPTAPSTGFWIAVLLSPVLLWVMWYLRAYLYYDRFVLVNTLLHMDKRSIFELNLLGARLLSFVLNVGGLFLLPLAVWVGFSGKLRTRFALAVFLLSLIPIHWMAPEWEWVHKGLLALLLTTGFLIFWEFILVGLDWRPHQLLPVFWFFGILAACLVLYYAGSVRYSLLALPPVILVWIRRVELSNWKPPQAVRIIWIATALTVLYALPISWADYRFAETYKVVAARLVDQYESAGHRVWYAGEWGFRYYFEKNGARPLPRTSTEAASGDILIKPYVAMPWVTLYDGEGYSKLLEQQVLQESFPLRVLDFSSHAGFYSTGWGLLPFSISTGAPWEWFNVYRIQKRYDGPIPEEESHW
ncbi:MAG: glycosyltransferase family 39 protein [Acidobacteriota bacterium]|nr:MAG: glycosyltransferase family 39 protein [Acidobacteriota bacterium]